MKSQPNSRTTCNPERIADIALFQSVIDGKLDEETMLSPELGEQLMEAYIRQGGETGADAEINDLVDRAVNAYIAALLEAPEDLVIDHTGEVEPGEITTRIEYNIFDAIRDNDLEKLKGFSNAIESGGLEWSPLHEAAKLGRTELLSFILTQRFIDVNDGFEIGEPDDFRRGTALTEALSNGHTETARLLIEQGANVNAEYYGYEDTHCLGLEIEESGNCLTLALAHENEDLISLLQSHGLQINRTFSSGNTELTAFAYYLERGDSKRLQKVFDLGADILGMVKDEWGHHVTPLMQALWLYREEKHQGMKKKRLAVVDWLLRHGVDLGHVHEQAQFPTALSVIMDANDPELNRLFGLIAPEIPR